MFIRIIGSCLIVSGLLAVTIQPARVNSAVQASQPGSPGDQAPQKINRPLPFEPGEVLTYNIGFSKLIFSGSIGQLKLMVRNGQPAAAKVSSSAPNSSMAQNRTELKASGQAPRPEAEAARVAIPAGPTGNIEFGAAVVSRGFFTWLFGIKIEDSYGAVVRSDDFGLVRSWKDIDQGDLHRRYETRVDRESGAVSYSESDRNKAGPATVKTGVSPRWVLDLLSAVYFIRTQELKEGTTITMPLTDVGQVYMIDVIPVKRDEVEVEAGKFKSIQLELKIFDGKYIKRSGQLFVWLSDDARRLPVRARVKSSGATVNITLARLEHLS